MMRLAKDRTGHQPWLAAALVTSVILGSISCNDEISGPLARVGELRVSVITDGEDKSTFYFLRIDSDPQVNIGINSTTSLQQVPVGAHEVRLSGLPSNCTTASTSSTVQVHEGTVAEAEFRVLCVARVGAILVATLTTGSDVDSDGYVVTLDDLTSLPAGNNSEVTFTGVREGSHRIRLSGLAPNCVGGGEVARTVSFAAVVRIPFGVACSTIGSLRVSVSSTGPSIDANGYRVRVGARSIPVPSTGSVVIDGVPAGANAVSLEDVAPNCAVSAPAVKNATVFLNQTTEVEFSVVCVPPTGSIVVSTITNGTSLDPDGYSVILDDQASLLAPVTGQITITGVAAGSRRVRLAGVAPNCAGGAEVAVSVSVGVASNVQFVVVCAASSGAINVAVSTTGPATDINGYRVTAFTQNVLVQATGSVILGNIPVGSHQVRLEDVAVNCEVAAPAIKSAIVTANQIVNVDFNVNCTAPTLIAYAALVSNNWDIYRVLSNGDGITRLTTSAVRDLDPDWSPDGRIAFASERDGNFEIYVMNADGTNQSRLTDNAYSDRSPAWSPDGSKIAFTSARDGGNMAVYVMNADGTGAQRLTNTSADEADPAWSPDGAKLVFTRQAGGVHQVHIMNADGNGVTRIGLGGDPESGPAWSPDGSTLAFARFHYYYGNVVMTIRVDGTGPQNWIAYGDGPSWSPDGRMIVYRADYFCQVSSCLVGVNVLGGQTAQVVGAGPVATPAWRR